MTLTVRQFACLSDNYGFLIRDEATGLVATVDTPDAEAILAEIEASGWGRLDLILNTHWHPDHTQGNARLQAETGCEIVGPEEVRRAAPLDRAVRGGDLVRLGETVLEVTDTPGHTLGHIVYRSVADAQAFVGDTLFALGCGRLFEGTAPIMWESLSRLNALPAQTLICSGHDYCRGNGAFALSVDAGNAALQQRLAETAAGLRPCAPATLAEERATNPFLRVAELRPSLGLQGATDAQVFARLRAMKDAF